LAVTYLAGIINTQEEEGREECRELWQEVYASGNALTDGYSSWDEGWNENWNENWNDDADDLELHDEGSAYPELNYDSDDEIYNMDDLNSWVESDWRIPLVDIRDIRFYRNNGNEPMAVGFGNMLGGGFMKNVEKPYWTDCREGSICIFIPGDFCVSRDDVELLDEFSQNKNVFVLSFGERLTSGNPFFNDDFPYGENGGEGFTLEQDFENEMLLEYGSDSVNIELKKEEAFNYYKLLFNCWLDRYNLRVEENFPMDEVITQLSKVKRGDKSHMMNRLLAALCEKEEVYGELKKEHLSNFGLFKYIFKDADAGVKGGLEKLENELVGLETVKEQVRDVVNTMKLNRLREKEGMSDGGPHNVILMLGAPGTAKTTVAKLLGNIMLEENLLPGNRFICVNGAELKGKYVGHSAPKTKQIFDNYDVIMIDEAYSLSAADAGGMDTFAQEALAQLMIELENHSRDKLVMFAGYGGEGVPQENNRMLEFINANPGLASRISYTIEFTSYSAQDMVKIVHKQAELMKFKLDKRADAELLAYFEERVRDRNFGNGREARSLIENCQCFMARRIFSQPEDKCSKNQLETISRSDVSQAINKLKAARRSQIGVRTRFGFI
jgi:hypothetical protein